MKKKGRYRCRVSDELAVEVSPGGRVNLLDTGVCPEVQLVVHLVSGRWA